MLPKSPRNFLYALLLVLLSVVFTSAIANTDYKVLDEIAAAIKKTISDEVTDAALKKSEKFIDADKSQGHNTATRTVAMPMFMTIIQGADEEVGCPNDGSTVARFNLCGDSDDRTISLAGAPFGSISWEILGGSCTPDINEDCPDATNSCYTQVSTAQNFTIDASSIPSTTGAEFRVRVNGSGAYYYFKVKKSTISQSYVKQDFICGVPGRIQITNLSSAYEFSIDSGSGFGPWQGPIFDNLNPGTYDVKARLQNTPSTCEYPYEPITIDQLDIDIDVTFTDAQCSGDTGTITVTANNVPGPYKYTLLDSSGVAQEFTAFIPDNPYTFSAVGFGTYIVQVETQQCTGDPLNGIDPPRESLDTGGNPIIIGSGLSPLDASTEVNSSFGCSTITDVDITVNTSGGSAPYTFTVNGGPSQPSYAGTTTYNVTSPGTYDFIITDSNGCTITASSNVEDLLPPDVTANGIDGTCSNGGAKIDFNIIDARGYNLSYRVNAIDPWETNPLISVPAGTYNNIEVRYQQGGFECTMTLPSVTVTNVGAITGSASKIVDRTCDGSGGVIGGQIDFAGPFTGGSGSGYVFSIDGLNFTASTSYPGLSPGTYTPMIEDGGGCRLELTPITILDVDPPTDLDFAQSNINCSAGTSDVQLTPTSNAAITNYSVISPVIINNGGSDNFIGLSTNTSYIFQITDANNCTYTEAFTPAQISSIRARVKSGGDLRVCNGATDGTGTFLIDGFANNYTYDINGGLFSGGPQISGEVVLPLSGAGTYTITVTDVDTGCTDTASFDILDAPVLTLGGTVTPMTCANGNLGRVVANAAGGWGTNRYTLVYPGGATTVGPKSGSTFGNLSMAGTYTLSVEDSEGCTATFNFDLTPLSAPTVSLDAAASDFCFVPATGATIAVTSTAGSAPLASHQYRINGGALQAGPAFTGLAPGDYIIEVVDGNSCSDTVNVTINPQLRVYTNIVTEIPCGGAPGQIRVIVAGGYTAGAGTKQYEVSADNGLTFSTPVALTSTNFLYDTNIPGDYIFRVVDNEGCTADSAPVTLAPPISLLPPSIESFPVSCGNVANGRVVITPDATDGVPPYEINFNNLGFGDQSSFSNLAVGTYPLVIRDARGCEYNGTVDILLDNTPAPDSNVSEIQAVCSTSIVSGGIRINNVTDGTPDFSFIIEDILGNQITRQDNVALGALPLDITDAALIPGDYRVITVDANGCTDEDFVTITTNEVTITPIPPPVPVICDDSGFTYAVSVSGGSGFYEIKLEQQPAFYPLNNTPGVNDHTFSNLTDGIQYGVAYTVEVRDTVTGCIYLQEIPPIEGPSPLDISASSNPAACYPNINGELLYSITGFVVGDQLQIELYDQQNGTQIVLDTPITTIDPHVGNHFTPAGDYQIIVTNLTDTCTDAIAVTIDQNLPAIDVLNLTPANCNADGSFTVQGRGGDGGPYTYAFMPQGNVPGVGDYDTVTTFFGPAGNYDVYVMDNSGCSSFAIANIIPIDLPPSITTVVDNQCDVTSTSFDITVRVPDTVDTPLFTLGGDSQYGVLNGTVYEYTFNVSSPGDYIVDVIDANGCTGQDTASVYEFLSASGSFLTVSTCNDADGVIEIIPNGGSGDFDYVLTGLDYNLNAVSISQTNNQIFTNLFPGNYQVVVTDRIVNDGLGFCTFTVNNIILDAAIPPVILPTTPQDVTCNGDNDGSIDIVLQAGTDVDSPISYQLVDFITRAPIANNNSGSFPNLGPGQYEVEVLSARNCPALSGPLNIAEPAPFSITASAPDFACEPGANRYSSTVVTVGIVDPGTVGTGYQYSITGFSNYQSANTFEIVDNGLPQNITVYAIDGNGCPSTFNLPTLNPPTDITSSIIQVDPLNCQDDERVRIQIVGTTDFTVTTVSVAPVAPVTNAPGNDYVDVFLPATGDYIFEVTDNIAGCAYPMPVHTVIEPIDPIVTISEAKAVSCFVPGNDGELFIEVTDYIGVYTYNVYSNSDPGKTTVLATGSFDTNNFPDIMGDPARITGLTGGNFFVEVISNDIPFCSGDSNVATIRTPNGPLQVDAIEVGNTGCNNDTGNIEATGQGGWDGSPYEYRLLISADGGVTYPTEVVAFSNTSAFENLPSGDYQVEIRDVEGCTDTFELNLPPVPQIDAGIREPLSLQCPGGNNAVLEAYDPTTGDAITATAGATGGYPGAGYNYRLLYLNSNDNTDIVSTSGLQNSPTFIGASGGFISEGWYAIEVSSSFDCLFVTTPYYVDPPPPVDPKLVQTRVPGCGGMGEIRLTIENPDPLFIYEYLAIENGVAIGVYTDMTGTSELFPGVAGITYQFDVRKKNALNICPAVTTNGITMTDASGITLLPNQPDDISCASELDGRIESFINGGVGNNLFYLYAGDPVDAFSPSATATLVRGPQDNGTFEGLPEGATYYIAVTSGVTCSDIAGPFEIVRPEPILFNGTPTPVTCSGMEDGTISIEVTSGGVGLIQFAIEPHFNEFFSDPSTPGIYTFEELAAGSYEILIQDENGCFEKQTFTVTEPDEVSISNVSTTPETCIGFADGTAQLTIVGGTPFVDPVTFVNYYETMLVGPNSDGSEVFVRNDNLFFDNLIGGETYIVFVQDANMCGDDVLIPIEIGVDLTAETPVLYGCEGIFPNSTISVVMQDTSLLPQLLFSLDVDDINQADTQTTWGDLSAGDHTVYIYHENGCTSFEEFTIDSYDPLTISAVKTGPNELTATAAGGFGGYEYFFQGESFGTENIYTTNESTTVTVRVVDQNGCVAEVRVPFEFTGMLEIPNFFTPDGDNNNDVWSPKNRDFFPNIEVKIYDRYGRVVAILDQVRNWDGNYDGSPVPSGDYWYVVNANDKSEIRYVGHFTLYR